MRGVGGGLSRCEERIIGGGGLPLRASGGGKRERAKVLRRACACDRYWWGARVLVRMWEDGRGFQG